MSNVFTIIYILISITFLCECIKLTSVQKTYDKGVKAYTEERWSECIRQFEESIHLYKLHKSITVNCRLKCNSQNDEMEVKEDIADLKLYEKFFKRKECLIKCHEKDFGDLRMDRDIEEKMIFLMNSRKPYEYLHYCFYQMNALPKAASAAYTFLVANMDDEPMKQNLEYYLKQPEVDPVEVVDLQSEDYQVLYKLGLRAYKRDNWFETAANMEEVLTDYLASENSCRVECERQPEQEWSTEFYITMSNSIASLLHCQQQCQDKLKVMNYSSGIEFVADILNYIQICYYHLERYNDAAKAVASYLMILPDDEDMLENKRIYSSMINATAFTERSDISYYYKRDSYEKQLLHFFHRGDSNNADDNAV